MYQNMRVPVIGTSFITHDYIATFAEIKTSGEVVAPLYIDSKTDNRKYGLLIEYGNYLYIENKPNSGYNINVSFLTNDIISILIPQGTNYSFKVICPTFIKAATVNTNET